jgi:hypothetical protein
VPRKGDQSLPSIENVPSTAKRPANIPNLSGTFGMMEDGTSWARSIELDVPKLKALATTSAIVGATFNPG